MEKTISESSSERSYMIRKISWPRDHDISLIKRENDLCFLVFFSVFFGDVGILDKYKYNNNNNNPISSPAPLFIYLFIYLRIFTEDKHFSNTTVINMCPLYTNNLNP